MPRPAYRLPGRREVDVRIVDGGYVVLCTDSSSSWRLDHIWYAVKMEFECIALANTCLGIPATDGLCCIDGKAIWWLRAVPRNA